MKWLLLDSTSAPNKPALVNLASVDCISWSSGTLCIDFNHGCIETECEFEAFKQLASSVQSDIVMELE